MKDSEIIAVVLLLACILFLGNQLLGVREQRFFTAALFSENVRERVTVDGRDYTVLQGAVFSDGNISSTDALKAREAAYAKALLSNNPLLAKPGSARQSFLQCLRGNISKCNNQGLTPPHASTKTINR